MNNWLKRLVQLDNNDWRPPALWAMRHHSEDPQFSTNTSQSSKRLAASMLLRRVYATPRSTRYADLLKQLERGHGLDSPAFQLSPEERSETKRRLNDEIYRIAPVRKYVLLGSTTLRQMRRASATTTRSSPLSMSYRKIPRRPVRG